MCVCVWFHLCCVQLFATPWTIACQAPLSMGFSRKEYWSGLPFPSPGIFLTQGLNPGLLHCRLILYHCELPGKPILSNIQMLWYEFSKFCKEKLWLIFSNHNATKDFDEAHIFDFTSNSENRNVVTHSFWSDSRINVLDLVQRVLHPFPSWWLVTLMSVCNSIMGFAVRQVEVLG